MRGLEAEAPVLLQGDELPPAIDAWDAWDDARQGATGVEDRRALAGAGAGKSAAREQAGPLWDAQCPLLSELRLALPAALAWVALYRQDVVRSGAQSYAARAVVPRRARTEQRDAA